MKKKLKKNSEDDGVKSDEKRLFGTDGIRGTANQFPMTPDIVLRVGQAIGYLLRQQSSTICKPKVVIGKDTRLSGYMIEQALSSGLNSMGVNVQLVGPLPTPGISFLTTNMRADAGIVISASHNPFTDNGIKIFGRDGFKIDECVEQEVKRLVFEFDLNSHLPSAGDIGRSKRIDDSAGRYIVYVKSTFPLQLTLDGMRVVLDCANGAAYKVAPAVFEELGAETFVLGNEPNGLNINDKSGALYPQKVSEAVREYRADVGISLDGDADRVIMVDEKGRLVNGDHILAICGQDLAELGKLPKMTVVATEMSNFGLDQCLKRSGISVVRTEVGDKYVVEKMRSHGFALGGEQSGHIIFLDKTSTGDGLIAALNVLAVMKRKGKKLSQLNAGMEDVPQVQVNARIRKRAKFEDIPGYQDLVQRCYTELRDAGRVFVRYSGTEPVVRVLVEGPNSLQISEYANEIAGLIQQELA